MPNGGFIKCGCDNDVHVWCMVEKLLRSVKLWGTRYENAELSGYKTDRDFMNRKIGMARK